VETLRGEIKMDNEKQNKMRKICRLFRKLYPKDKAVSLSRVLASKRPVSQMMERFLDALCACEEDSRDPSIPLSQWIRNARDPSELVKGSVKHYNLYRKVSGKQVLRVLDTLRAQLGEDPENKVIIESNLFDNYRFVEKREPTLAELDKVIQLLEREESNRARTTVQEEKETQRQQYEDRVDGLMRKLGMKRALAALEREATRKKEVKES
jgi:hypothetical protein